MRKSCKNVTVLLLLLRDGFGIINTIMGQFVGNVSSVLFGYDFESWR